MTQPRAVRRDPTGGIGGSLVGASAYTSKKIFTRATIGPIRQVSDDWSDDSAIEAVPGAIVTRVERDPNCDILRRLKATASDIGTRSSGR
jgi:hypothetical protein